jgi:hypothetical protein
MLFWYNKLLYILGYYYQLKIILIFIIKIIFTIKLISIGLDIYFDHFPKVFQDITLIFYLKQFKIVLNKKLMFILFFFRFNIIWIFIFIFFIFFWFFPRLGLVDVNEKEQRKLNLKKNKNKYSNNINLAKKERLINIIYLNKKLSINYKLNKLKWKKKFDS